MQLEDMLILLVIVFGLMLIALHAKTKYLEDDLKKIRDEFSEWTRKIASYITYSDEYINKLVKDHEETMHKNGGEK